MKEAQPIQQPQETKQAPLYCPTHTFTQLRLCYSSGAGWCDACRVYVQALGVPMPELDEHVKAKRAAKKSRKRKKSNEKPNPAPSDNAPAVEEAEADTEGGASTT